MKRSTLLVSLFAIAISLCFFSSTVLAGGGTGTDRTHPWDLDQVGNDTTSGGVDILYKSDFDGGENSLSWISISLSSRFTMWLYNSQIISKKEMRTDVEKQKIRKTRGKLLNNF